MRVVVVYQKVQDTYWKNGLGKLWENAISSSRQLVTMLYNHGGVGQTGWWYKHEDYSHKEFGWFWDYMEKKGCSG